MPFGRVILCQIYAANIMPTLLNISASPSRRNCLESHTHTFTQITYNTTDPTAIVTNKANKYWAAKVIQPRKQ